MQQTHTWPAPQRPDPTMPTRAEGLGHKLGGLITILVRRAGR